MVVAIMLVGFAVKTNTAAAAECTISSTLRVGSKGAQVTCLQAGLGGLVADGNFGAKTKAAVKAWQAGKGLVADGIFGAKSRAAWTGAVVVTPAGLPAGCTSTAGYSPVTGVSCSSGVPATQTGPLAVTLAADNPAAGTIITGQATADLAHFTFTGNGTLNQVVLQRTGISDQSALSNVYLYDGMTRLTDGYSFNNSGQLTMNSLGIVVNGSKTLSVKADVASGTPTSSSIAVTLVSYTVTGGTANAVSVKGNEMSISDGTGMLAGAVLSANTVANANVNAGTTAYTFWSAPLQINTRAVSLKGANFRMIGSAPSDAIAGIKLYVDGVAVGSVASIGTISGSNYAMFDFAMAPVSLSTGSHTVDVRGDVQKGSARTVQLSVQSATDLVIFDAQLGVNIAASGVLANNAGTISIQAGSVTISVDSAFGALTNVTGGSSNVAIGKYKVHAYGEDVKVQSLVVQPVVTNVATTYTSGTTTLGANTITVGSTAGFYAGDVITVAGGTPGTATITSITSATVMVVNFTVAAVTPAGAVTNTTSHNNLANVTLYFNGSQIGTQQNFTGTNLTFTLGSQLIAPAGMDSVLEVRADIRSTTSVNYTGGTVRADLIVGSSNAQGQNSLNALSTPAQTGNTLTIQTGLLVASKNGGYANQNVNPNTTGVKVGSFILQNQSSSESVRVTSMTVGLTFGGGGVLTDYAALRTSETSGSGATPVQPQVSNTFSVDFTLAPGATKTVDVLADTGTNTGVQIITALGTTSIGVSSNVSSTTAAVTGQTITTQVGTVTNPPTLVSSSSTTAQLVPAANGGAANATKATFNFAATGGAAKITELKFTVTGTDTVTSVSVGGVSAPVVSGVAYLTGLNLTVPLGGSGLNQEVLVSYSEVGASGVASYTSSTVALTYVKYTSGSTTANFSPTVSAPTMVVVGSKPAYTLADSSDTLSNGQRKIASITVSADAKGDIKIGQLPITVTSTGLVSVGTGTDNIVVKDTNGVVIPTTNATFAVAAGGSGSASICFDTAVAACASGQGAANGYLIAAGTSKTFDIFATAATVSGAVNTTSLSTVMGVNTNATWYDVAGNSTTVRTAASVFNYPTTTSVITN